MATGERWECPGCDRTYPDSQWTIGGDRIEHSRPIGWSRGRPAEPFFKLWHACPAKPNPHFYDGGAPYTGGPTRAFDSNGMQITLSTMPQ